MSVRSRRMWKWLRKSLVLTGLATLSVVANAAGKGDVTTTAKLPPPFTGYVKTTVHQDGSIDVQAYKDAKLRNPYAYHGRWDPPENQTLGQKYPVTLKLHAITANARTDMTFTFQDASGNNAKIKGTTVQEDGTVTKLDLSVKNGVANGTGITEDGQTELITDMPMKDMRRYLPSGGFRLSGIAAGSATELHFDPALLSAKEREAWQRNQENIAKETLPRTQNGWSVPPNLKGIDLIDYCDKLYKACNAGCEKYAPNNLHIVECGGGCGIKANKCASVH